eukprot:532893-Pyramimonas_sp.AAC.1
MQSLLRAPGSGRYTERQSSTHGRFRRQEAPGKSATWRAGGSVGAVAAPSPSLRRLVALHRT